jgi:predicted DNA repair protein MutK
MAGSSLLVLIDDIATILDDVSLMSKVALKKTAGVVGDDLALNAQQLVGVKVNRELPVVWAVAKGSAINKMILVPAALLISALIPWAITPLLMLGGAFLCFEGFEKLLHKWLHGAEEKSHHAEHMSALKQSAEDVMAVEREKIRGAIRTDFILSAEIIVIALGTIAAVSFPMQIAVLVTIAVLMTIGVYGLVAGIIKLDDLGMYLSLAQGNSLLSRSRRGSGRLILTLAPYLMRTLSIAGTIAMFTVGGGILTHGVPAMHHGIEHLAHQIEHVGGVGKLLGPTSSFVLQALVGIAAGGVLVLLVTSLKRFWPK